nr:hypothetical protein [Parapedobacter lycopersici]
MLNNRNTWMGLWGMPVLLGVITMLGLLAAIMSADATWHAVSWVLLAIPLYVMIRYGIPFFRR